MKGSVYFTCGGGSVELVLTTEADVTPSACMYPKVSATLSQQATTRYARELRRAAHMSAHACLMS